MQAPVPKRRFSFVSLLVMVLLPACLVAVLAAWFFNNLAVFGDPERREINAVRRTHFASWVTGTPLAGTPDLARLETRLKAGGLTLGSPVLIRIFKREFELELWMARDGRFERFATYPICVWSGWLGPKIAAGDRQAPEGFYTVGNSQMNPNSRWHRSFNLGFPNAFDAAHGRTGSALMVHGGCSSIGCFAMGNAVIDEVWRLTTAALAGKQKVFQVQVFPFRMSEQNLAAHQASPHIEFWRQLKRGNDLFEATGQAPVASVCRGGYRFKAGTGAETVAAIGAACSDSSFTEKNGGKKAL